jgi:IclR family transcriptional regulator, acetate operon repressor
VRIGSRISLLNAGFRRQFSTARDLLPFVEGLSSELQETTYLSQLTREGLVVQLQVEAEQALRVAGHGVGFVGMEHVRASGKAVMAFMEPEARDRLLASLLGGESKTAAAAIRRRLKADFEEIRAKGWALDREEYQAGVCCVGAPFFAADGSVCGSIGVSLPAARYDLMHDEIAAAVLRTAAELSRVHGYEPPATGTNQ